MKPFLADRPSAPLSALRPLVSSHPALPGTGTAAGSAPAGASAPGHAHAGHAPAVECIRQGDKVVRLVVTCSCGERIEIECLYPAGA